jgi:uncharacterized membrane protein
MESKAKLIGHPVHPMLVVFPLGLLATSLLFDIAYLTSKDSTFGLVSFWMIVAGIIGGLLAAIFGAIDWWAIPSGTRAKAIGLWHGAGNVVVVVLFLMSAYLRMNSVGYTPAPAAVAISCIAVALALVTGWLGGELVDRLGVGVDDGAHLNAPSSLSGLPATERPRPASTERIQRRA